MKRTFSLPGGEAASVTGALARRLVIRTNPPVSTRRGFMNDILNGRRADESRMALGGRAPGAQLDVATGARVCDPQRATRPWRPWRFHFTTNSGTPGIARGNNSSPGPGL